MCLKTLHKHRFIGRTGWKILTKDEKGRYHTGIAGASDIILYKSRYTRTEGLELMLALSVDTYPAGFHIFTNKEQARQALKTLNGGIIYTERVLCYVAFREQVAYGQSYWYNENEGHPQPDTVVAKECKILEVLD